MNTQKLKVKPAREGLKIMDPKTGAALPFRAVEVEDTSYWRRRIADGDLIAVKTKTNKE